MDARIMDRGKPDTSHGMRRNMLAYIIVGVLLTLAPLSLLLAVFSRLIAGDRLIVVLIALLAGFALWLAERRSVHNLESHLTAMRKDASRVLIPIAIFLAAFCLGLNTVHTYFLTDEFALIHAFHQLTPAQFLQLLHMDTRVFVSGDARQEFRPFYGLYYAWGWHAFGLRIESWHLLDLCLHAAVASLVYFVVLALAPGSRSRAAFAGFLFAVQPPNAQATSLIVCGVAESVPAIFYLSALWAFVCFRRTRRITHLALSMGAFVGCLLTKESGVSLPFLLLASDLVYLLPGDRTVPGRKQRTGTSLWLFRLAPYAGYAFLLVFYLEWRRKVLTSFLREDAWGSHASAPVPVTTSVGMRFLHFAHHLWQLQCFNAESLFPYAVPSLGIVLGILFLWAYSFWSQDRSSKSTLLPAFCFGLIWYLFTNIPYIVEGQVAYHLYLPAIGLWIAVGCVAFPANSDQFNRRSAVRVAAAVVLLTLSNLQMRKSDANYAHLGDLSRRMAEQLPIALQAAPTGGVVILWPAQSELVASGWAEGIVPFAAQPPFSPVDLSTRQIILMHPDFSCCGTPPWWNSVAPILSSVEHPALGNVDVSLISWDDSRSAFSISTRSIPRSQISATVQSSLGGAPDSLDSITEAQAIALVQNLARLVTPNLVPQPVSSGF